MSSIVKPVTWHRGGALGEPWPWGDLRISPKEMRYRFQGPDEAFVREQTLWLTSWHRVICYADPADLEPPTAEEMANAD